MNSRDLMLYSYIKGQGGGGSEIAPKIVDYTIKFNGTSGSSWDTDKNFSVKAGDYILVAVRHTQPLQAISGFEVIDSISYSSYTLSVLKFVATQTETIKPVIKTTSSGNIAGAAVQITGANTITRYDSGTDTGSYATISIPNKFFIFFTGNSANYSQELKTDVSGLPKIAFVSKYGNNNVNIAMGYSANSDHPSTQAVTTAYGYSYPYAFLTYAFE